MARSLEKLYELLLIRPNERKTVLFFFGVFFLIGCGLSLGRGTADALFFKRYGIEYLPIMFSLAGALLAVVFTLYAAFVDQISSNKLLTRLLAVSAFVVILSWLTMNFNHSEQIYPVYFLVYEVISEVLILHISLYVAQNFSTQQAKRLIPLILAGTQTGYIIGGIILATASKFTDVHNILILWFLLLSLVGLIIHHYHNNNGTSPYYRPTSRSKHRLKQAVSQLKQGIKYTHESHMLRAMSWAFFFMVVAFYTLCYSTNRLYNQTFVNEADLAAFFGIMSSINATVALALQIFITNKIIKNYGVQRVNLIFPIMICISFCLLLGAYVIPLAIFATFVKDAIMPAFRNPVRNIFFNALPLQMQGRARAITIGFILPFALVATGIMLWLVQRAELPQLFLLSGLIISLAYLFFNIHMNRSYIPTIVKSLRQKIYVPDKGLFDADDENAENAGAMLHTAISHTDPEIKYSSCKTLIKIQGKEALPTVLPILQEFNYAYQDRLIKLMFPYLNDEQIMQLWKDSASGDAHYRATISRELFKNHGDKYQDEIHNALNNSNPRIVMTGIYGVFVCGIDSLRKEATTKWMEYLHSTHTGKILCGIELFAKFEHPDYVLQIVEFLDHPHARVKRQAAAVLSHSNLLDNISLLPVIKNLAQCEDSSLRIAACKISDGLDWQEKYDQIAILLNDPHPKVRMAAAQTIFHRTFKPSELLNWIMNNPLSPRAQSSLINIFAQKEPSHGQLTNLSNWLAQRANTYLEMAVSTEKSLKQSTPSLLPVLLRERCIESLALSLKVAKYLEDEELVTTALAGINSVDNQVIDNAVEAILGFKNKQLSRTIVTTLEQYRDSQLNTIDKQWTLEEIGDVCKKEKDNWLTACVNKYLSTGNSLKVSYA